MTARASLSAFAWHLAQVSKTRAEAIEYACEAALQTGTMGVLVTQDGSTMEPNGVLTYTITAKPDPSVPYGVIEYTADAMLERWI